MKTLILFILITACGQREPVKNQETKEIIQQLESPAGKKAIAEINGQH